VTKKNVIHKYKFGIGGSVQPIPLHRRRMNIFFAVHHLQWLQFAQKHTAVRQCQASRFTRQVWTMCHRLDIHALDRCAVFYTSFKFTSQTGKVWRSESSYWPKICA
jgi:hypothetical protein